MRVSVISQFFHLGRSVQVMAQAAIYRPRRPQESALYQCLEHYWEEFQQAYPLLYEKDYGPLRPVVEQQVRASTDSVFWDDVPVYRG